MSDETTLAVRDSAGSGLDEPYARFSDEVAGRVLAAYASGKSLRKIAKMPGMPSRSTLREWEHEHAAFRTALTRARADKAEWHAERGAARLAKVEPDSPYGGHRVSKAREQAAYDKWMAGCLDRQTWGDKMQLDVKAAIVLRAFTDAAPQVAATVVDTLASSIAKPPATPSAFDIDAEATG